MALVASADGICYVDRSYIECPQCRYATACGESYTNHMSVVHFGKSSSSSATVPMATVSVVGMRLRSTLRSGALYCDCGYTSQFGSVIGMLTTSVVCTVSTVVLPIENETNIHFILLEYYPLHQAE